MRQAREIIRLKSSSLSAAMNDEALEAALYANRRSKRGHRRIEEPDWAGVHHELKRKHVNFMILWDEYIAENPGGYKLFAVLRALPRLCQDAAGDDAADARCRGTVVCRLRRRRRSCRRPAHRPMNAAPGRDHFVIGDASISESPGAFAGTAGMSTAY